MPTVSRTLWFTGDARRPRDEDGRVFEVPRGWALLPPGDAGLTRRVKKAGPTWSVKLKRGRRVMSRGVWAPAEVIDTQRAQLAHERAQPAYRRRLEAGRKRRAEAQVVYARDFTAAVQAFLSFAPRHQALELELAEAIAAHATPVGSNTVARTQRISVQARAQAATIAWLRHHMTGYDDMVVPRVKGKRREIRRMLAAQSRRMLARYRSQAQSSECSEPLCPLREALDDLAGLI